VIFRVGSTVPLDLLGLCLSRVRERDEIKATPGPAQQTRTTRVESLAAHVATEASTRYTSRISLTITNGHEVNDDGLIRFRTIGHAALFQQFSRSFFAERPARRSHT
jgi:hypothetical protein